jgi:hypothetical protein
MNVQLNDDYGWILDVQGLIPRDVLERVIRVLRLEEVLHVQGSATFELEGVRSEFARIGIRAFHPEVFREFKRKKLKRALSELGPHPLTYTRRALSEILETAFILDMMEKGEK